MASGYEVIRKNAERCGLWDSSNDATPNLLIVDSRSLQSDTLTSFSTLFAPQPDKPATQTSLLPCPDAFRSLDNT
jgi:hypothetical protein